MNVLMDRNSDFLTDAATTFLGFLRQSGRMIVMPVWSQTLETNDGAALQDFMRGNASRTAMTRHWARDLRRTIDYLETRDDVDLERLGYLGLSLGAAIGGAIVPYESRLATSILWSGGFGASSFPESAQNLVSLTRRITHPVLMLNGRHDFVFPYEPHQTAFFELLGTPPEHKRHVVWDAGHFGFPLGEFVRENLDWLDRYLGPVAPAEG